MTEHRPLKVVVERSYPTDGDGSNGTHQTLVNVSAPTGTTRAEAIALLQDGINIVRAEDSRINAT